VTRNEYHVAGNDKSLKRKTGKYPLSHPLYLKPQMGEDFVRLGHLNTGIVHEVWVWYDAPIKVGNSGFWKVGSCVVVVWLVIA
jgi:hypothetical protein